MVPTRTRTWDQLALTGDWADKPIHLYGYTPEYHFGGFVFKEVMQGGSSWNENIKQFANFTRPDGPWRSPVTYS